MAYTYQPPVTLQEWTLDVPGGELYQLFVYDNETVCSTVGRHAHSSGSSICSWRQFLTGSLNDVVRNSLGAQTLDEALAFVANLKQG